MKGTREQRAQLVRDSNKLVATAVLSSPKLTESEVEAFAKMANVWRGRAAHRSATNRAWLKNYGVIARPGEESEDAARASRCSFFSGSTSRT